MKRTLTKSSFWLQLLTENSQNKTSFLFNSNEYIENALSGGSNTFWHHILLSWKKMKWNVEHGITDRFKVYTEIPELYRYSLNLLPDKGFLKNRYIKPEIFIERKIVDEEEIYRFLNF